MNILMINLPFSGHTNPTLPLTRELIKRGHNVTYINAEMFRQKIEETGAKFVPYINFPAEPTDRELKKLCFPAAFDTAMSLEQRYDLLIYEMFFYPGIEIARRMGIPCVRQFSQPAWSEKTWQSAPAMFKISAFLIDRQMPPKEDARRMGLEKPCLHDGIIGSKPELNIVYLPKQFQGHRDSFDDSYIFVLPEPAMTKSDIVIPYEKMTRPIVYISLGSIISNKGFCKECIKAFGGGTNKAHAPFSVILNTGKVKPETLGKIPENIYAYPFVPQIEVLSHTDVFLTHCGMNSINEALCFGVPMVAMPFMNDQITNAVRITRLGLGKRVRSFPSRGAELYRTVCEVWEDKSFKERTEKMRRLIKRQPTWDEIITRIEKLAEKAGNRNF